MLAALLVFRSDTDAQFSRQVKATFVGFDVLDGGSEKLALIQLTNSSSRSFWYFTTGEIASNGAPVAMGMYRKDTGGGWNPWSEGVTSPKKITGFTIPPSGSDMIAARISSIDERSQIGIHFTEQRSNWAEPLQSLRRLWWKLVPPRPSSVRAWCDLTATNRITERATP